MKSPFNYRVIVTIVAIVIVASCDKKNDKQLLVEDVPVSGVTDEGISPNIGIFAPPEITSTRCALPKIIAERPPNIDSGLADLSIGTIKLDSGKTAVLNSPGTLGEWDSTGIDEFGDVWQAEFPGGMEAWGKFLRDSIHNDVPVSNNAPAGSCTVIVSFMIDKSANVTNVKANQPWLWYCRRGFKGYAVKSQMEDGFAKWPQGYLSSAAVNNIPGD